ncbi:hypothetical protein JW877_04110 [bacterium]|nr:hypothetical protein [bacterium]
MKKIIVMTLIMVILITGVISALHAADDIVLQAMRDEIGRSVNELSLEGYDPPYFISYRIQDLKQFELKASFGAILESRQDRSRQLSIEIRVGDYSFDNTNFIGSNAWRFSRRSNHMMPLENDYDAIRHKLWYHTDQEYKSALEALAQKKANLQNRIIKDSTPNFTKEEPFQFIQTDIPLESDTIYWKERIRELSGLFREFPEIHTSQANFRLQDVTKYFVNSEGTMVKQKAPLISLEVFINSRNKEGLEFNDQKTFYARSFSFFPDQTALIGEVREWALEFSRLLDADTLDYYVGPVILEGQAAAEFFYQLLGKNLSLPLSPLTEEDWQEHYIPRNYLDNKKDRNILPPDISVKDDPYLLEYDGKEVVGSYEVDDEGFPARVVNVVEEGSLKEFLSHRYPSKHSEGSNGHGRAAMGYSICGRISNLTVETEESLPVDELKNELIDRCVAQNLEYGIIIKKLENERFAQPSDENEIGLTAPLYAYKIYADDRREELIQNVKISNLTILILRDIVGISREKNVYNLISRGFSGDIPVSLVTPSILIEDMEIIPGGGKLEKPPLLEHPYFINE